MKIVLSLLKFICENPCKIEEFGFVYNRKSFRIWMGCRCKKHECIKIKCDSKSENEFD